MHRCKFANRRGASLTAALILAACSTPLHAQSAAQQRPAQLVPPFEAAVNKLLPDPSDFTYDYLMVPMRDGVRLSTIVVRPRAPGRYPVLLIRSPYQLDHEVRGAWLAELLRRGYALVFQNERGAGLSEGPFHLLGHTAEDGYDTISWIAAQPWSTGKVGMSGCSSSGDNQVRLGTMQHPAHAANVTMSSGTSMGGIPGVADFGGITRNGVPQYSAWASWFMYFGAQNTPKLPSGLTPAETGRALRYFQPGIAFPLNDVVAQTTQSMNQLPSAEVLDRLGMPQNDYSRFLRGAPGVKATYPDLDLLTAADNKGSTPQIIVNGWGDVGVYEQLKLFEFMQDKPDQYLIMAPTRHCGMTAATENTMLGERPVGDARLPYGTMLADWYDRNLKGDRAKWVGVPRVQTYLIGAGTWLTGNRWPLPASRDSRLYLDSGGAANTATGDGRLLASAPRREGADTILSDPMHPVPSVGDGIFSPPVADQSAIEKRQDVLVFSTPPLTRPLAAVGEMKLVAFVSSEAKDADLSVKVEDVFPDGKVYNVGSTMIRLRYRGGLTRPELMTSGTVYRVEITGMATSSYFAPGHSLRVQIAGSNFPAFERNLQTGGPNATETQGVPAKITLHHGGRYASYLQLREYTGPIPKPKGN